MSAPPPAAPPSICLVQQSAGLDGSAISGLLVADALRESGCRTAVFFGRDGPMLARFRAAGHATAVVPHLSWLRDGDTPRFLKHLWDEYRAARRLHAALRRFAPDLIYVNTLVSLAGALAARRLGRPAIWHLRELFADVGGEMRSPAFVRSLVADLVRRCSRAQVATSRAVADNVLLGRSSRLHIVPNAGGPAYDAPPVPPDPAHRAALGFDPHRPLLGVPGTLRPVKGHPFLFAALPALLRAHPALQIAVTGEGDPAHTASLHATVRALGLAGHVRFLGALGDMPAFYRACDLVCIPSRTEAFGRAIIEALASGVPVVTTNAGGIPSIIRDGDTGLLVDYGDIAALAAALSSLLSSPDRRAEFSRRGRARYLDRFRTDLHHDAIRAIVRATLSPTPAAPIR